MKTVQILIVEDNEADAFLMQELFSESKYRNEVHIAQDGVQALDYLLKRGPYEEAPRPHLVLLDLNMPRKDGREVLAELKSLPDLRTIPVIVLTTSESEEDVRNSYLCHANCYISKPMGLDRMYEVVRSIEDFWFRTVTLP